jgi:hypothetical protein
LLNFPENWVFMGIRSANGVDEKKRLIDGGLGM